MNIFVIIYSLWICMSFLTQNKLFWRMLVIKQLLAPTDFHSMEKKIYTIEVNGYRQLFGYQHSYIHS